MAKIKTTDRYIHTYIHTPTYIHNSVKHNQLTSFFAHRFIIITIIQGLKIVWDASRPSLSLPLLPSPSFRFPFPFIPLRSRHHQLRLGGLGERSSSPSGSGRSPAAKRILTHFRPKFAPF